MNNLFGFFFVIGLVFGGIAGLIAFLVTFNEWQKHKFTGWKLWGEPLFRGIGTFILFFGLCLLIGYTL